MSPRPSPTSRTLRVHHGARLGHWSSYTRRDTTFVGICIASPAFPFSICPVLFLSRDAASVEELVLHDRLEAALASALYIFYSVLRLSCRCDAQKSMWISFPLFKFGYTTV